MITLASFGAGRRVLAVCGVQARQYQLLVDLFGSLGERKELVGNLGFDKGALHIASFMLLLPGLGLAALALAPMSLATFELTILSASSIAMLVILLPEAANSFLNPAEVSVLAPRPIAGSTYFAAKLTYLVVIVLRAELSLNGPAALTGVWKAEARWFYPFTHLSAALLAGLFLALVACAIFGVVMRVVPIARVRTVALWLQFVVAMAPLLFNAAQRFFVSVVRAMLPQAREIDWSFLPFAWFAALGVAGQARNRAPIDPVSASAGLLVSMLFIAFGVRALSSGYMTRIVAVTRSTRGAARMRRSSLAAKSVGRLSGSPAGRAAYEFMTRMMRRDWQFRRAAAQFLVSLLIFLPVLWRSMGQPSPFAADIPSAMSILPEIVGVATLMICSVVSFSDHHRASWIFGLSPAGALTRYIRGVFWTLWVLFAAAPVVVVALLAGRRWGMGDTLLFAAFSLAMTALLLAMQWFFVDGLPFADAPKTARTYLILPLIVFGPIVMGIAWYVQGRLLFSSRPATAVATLMVMGAATFTARRTMAAVEARVRRELARRASGGDVMFKAVDES